MIVNTFNHLFILFSSQERIYNTLIASTCTGSNSFHQRFKNQNCVFFLPISGYYCPYGVSPQPCPAGTYNNKTGMDDATQCTDCPPGYFCQGVGNINPTGKISFQNYLCAQATSQQGMIFLPIIRRNLLSAKLNFTQHPSLI